MCGGKISYDSERSAKKARNHYEWKRGRELRAYPCNKCWGYHLTSESKF